MTQQSLKLLSGSAVTRLFDDLDMNIERYRTGDFSDLACESGWEIETSLAKWDPSIADKLDPQGTPDAEIKNSLLIYQGLDGMTAALAREERLWARLCHVECLQYARQRWLDGKIDIKSAVQSHFFASGITGCRDDNAIGRLWWNGHIAALGSPDDLELGLRRLLGRANTRLQIVDRADTANREPLIQRIFHLLGSDPWINSFDAAVADFMREVNKRSGGIIFEALSMAEIDVHLAMCLSFAKAARQGDTKAAA